MHHVRVFALVSLILALAVLAVATATAGQAARGCTRSEARAALVAADVLAPGDRVAQLVCVDFNGDGRLDMAATAGVSESAGVVGWAAFVSQGDGWKVVQRHPIAYRPSLVRLGADLLEYEPVYLKGDPNCCPSGGSLDRLYRWRQGRLVLAYSWRQR